ncbi:MAG: hypothetical protein V8R80_04595 [Eubacterium sp.]
MDAEQVSHEIAAAGKEKGVSVIASHMNYGLYRVEDHPTARKMPSASAGFWTQR